MNDDDWHGADNRKQKLEKKTTKNPVSLVGKPRVSKKSITLAPKSLKHASHPEDPAVRFLRKAFNSSHLRGDIKYLTPLMNNDDLYYLSIYQYFTNTVLNIII